MNLYSLLASWNWKFDLLYRHECFTGKYTIRKIHTKPHQGLEWRIFHILTSEDIDTFADIIIVLKFVGVWPKYIRIFLESLRQSSEFSENVRQRSRDLVN